MKESINRFQVIDFFFPPAVAYFRFFSVLMDFKLEGLLGVSFFFFFFGIIIDMALWHPY